MEPISFLKKLAVEVEKNGYSVLKPEGNKSGVGIEKTSDEKSFPLKSEKGKNEAGNSKYKGGSKDEKKDGKTFPFGKKSEKEKGEMSESGDKGKKKDNIVNGKDTADGKEETEGVGTGTGNEGQTAGNVQAGGNAVSGGTVDPTIIIDFLQHNPAPDDASFHEFTESQGLDTHMAEATAYALAGKYVMFLRGGKSGGGQKDFTKVDPEQLNKGIEVEQEHTSDLTTAKKIALDHLVEFPDYYSRLEQMESSAGDIVAKPKQEKSEKKQEKEKSKEEKNNSEKEQEKK